MKFVLAVTCYNRLEFLKEFIESWNKTKNNNHHWTLIIADDGSNENQLNFIDSIKEKNKVVIKNKRRGISHQTNCIFKELEKMNYDICFKCDEDIIFKKKGWDDLYFGAVSNTNFKHICYDDIKFSISYWCNEGRILSGPKNKKQKNYNFIAYVKSNYSRGCFYTITKEIQNKIGFMDVKNFFHGFEHIDFYMRCSRLGFCDKDFAYDLKNSNEYIEYRHWEKNKPCLNNFEYKLNGNGVLKRLKNKIIQDTNRIYIPYQEISRKILTDIPLQ